MQMEIVQLVGRDSQGLCQRVFIELVRRKINVETAIIGKKEGRVIMLLGITNLPGKGKTLYALKAIPDVLSAEYLNERVACNWEAVPQNGHTFDIIKSAKEKGTLSF
jgi:chloramphenicol 3-O-phosphotransferase